MVDYILKHLGYIAADDNTTSRVSDIVEEGEAYLSGYNPLIDWGKPSHFHKSLLKNYCMYSMSNALDDFQTNYGKELMLLNAEWEVANAEYETEAE